MMWGPPFGRPPGFARRSAGAKKVCDPTQNRMSASRYKCEAIIPARPATPPEEVQYGSFNEKRNDSSQSRMNPYAKHLKRQITIRIDIASIEYFKQVAADLGMPYQNLINLFLRDCATHKRRPVLEWRAPSTAGRTRKPIPLATKRAPGR
jgi:uncharacterized protein (DUF4415 family)